MSHRIYVPAGIRFGRLQIVKEVLPQTLSCSRRQFECLCDCGQRCIATLTSLRRGYTKSCGCLRKEAMVQNARPPKHGMADTRTYSSWEAMKQRCLNPRHKNYKHYGGRGITICEKWLSFEAFYADMGTRPSPQHSIDRVDNEQGYYKANCRWATQTEQQRNTRQSKMLTMGGETLCVAHWADKTGLPSTTILSRLHYGYTVTESLSFPLHMKRKSTSGVRFAKWLETEGVK